MPVFKLINIKNKAIGNCVSSKDGPHNNAKPSSTPSKENDPKIQQCRPMNTLLFNRFEVGERIGFGSFGDIYSGFDRKTNRAKVAIKLEWIDPNRSTQFLQLEYKFYKLIQGEKEIKKGIPTVHYFRKYGEDRYALIIDRLGPSLQDLLDQCSKKFTIETCCEVAMQILVLLQHVHERGVIHRDIKPNNFLLGTDHLSNIVHIIDFGLAKEYIDRKTNKHIIYREDRTLCGTIKYISMNVHLGIEPSRRDDLESLGYMLVHFYKGKLPWQGLKGEDRAEQTYRLKESTPLKTLCADCPAEFLTFLTYVRGLEFYQTPDYGYLRDLFHNLLKTKVPNWQMEFDWIIKERNKTIKKQPMDGPFKVIASLGFNNNGIMAQN